MSDRPLRVLVLLASANRRGAEIEGERLARELVAAGIDASVAALSRGSEPALEVPVLGDRPLSLRTLRALRRCSRDVDVVIAYGSSTLPACALGLRGARIPFVYRSIGDPRAWARGVLHRRRTGWMLRRAERVVTLWPGARDAMVELYAVDRNRIDVIPNARSGKEFRPATTEERDAARARLDLPHDARVVSFIGSLTAEKRPSLAIDAMEHLPGTILLVAGSGPLRQDLEARAGIVAGDRVRFLGALTSLTDVYGATDVVLSTSSTEGMSGVLIEAGLSGIPVCATNVGATGWLFGRGLRGALVETTGTPSDIAVAIEQALLFEDESPALSSCDWGAVTSKWIAALSAFSSIRVLAVLDSTGAGGAETSTAAMAPLLREMGVDFQIAFFHDRGGVKQQLIDDGVPILSVPAGRCRMITLLRLMRLIRKLHPDVVHTAVYEADIIGRTAGWLCRTPVVSSIISDMYGQQHRDAASRPIKYRLAWFVDLVTARFVRRFHAVSATVAESVAPRLRIGADRITVVYRGRVSPRPDQFKTAAYLDRLLPGLPADTFVMLAVGRHDTAKDFATLVRAVGELGDNYHLLIAGRQGSQSNSLVSIVRVLHLEERVHFVGERSDVYELMSAVDVVVLPSRWEGLPGVALEALAIGASCVCSDLPIYREVFTAADGRPLAVFFAPGDHAALAELLRGVSSWPNDRVDSVACRLSFQERFGIERAVAHMKDLYLAAAR